MAQVSSLQDRLTQAKRPQRGKASNVQISNQNLLLNSPTQSINMKASGAVL